MPGGGRAATLSREIAGSGHIGIVTHPDEVAHHLVTFFAEH